MAEKNNRTDRNRQKKNKDLKQGELSITARGFGFVTQSDSPDIFVQQDNLGTALDGDIVEVEVFSRNNKRKPSGQVERVITRSKKPIVGVYRKSGKAEGLVTPTDDRIPVQFLVPKEELKRAGFGRKLKDDTVVVGHLGSWESKDSAPVIVLDDIVGKTNDSGIDLRIIALSRGLRLEFPEDVQKEIRKLRMPDLRKVKKTRRDLTSLPTLTIDPEDAQDFDDALSIVHREDGLFDIYVHIADVSAFVQPGSAIDREALERGTSVYFVGDVLPMLPEKLSNDLCSLRPGEERLAFTARMTVDSLAAVHDLEIFESVIRSDHRLTYAEAQEIMAGGNHPAASQVGLLQLVARTLRARREDEGSIDFDLPVPIITLDSEGLPQEVRRSERIESQRLIEELMLLANRSIAGHIAGRKGRSARPFVYRIHERPKQEDTNALLTVLQNLGIPLNIEGELSSEDFSRILDLVDSLDLRYFAEKIALRSMTKAVYSTDNQGHFGLAFDAYTHFTSPIRRYADLMVHRLLKGYLKGEFTGAVTMKTADLERICERCSAAERRAIDAEREHQKKKAMEFLKKKVGRTYSGVISGVSRLGLFVELVHYLIEGLVPVDQLGSDFYLLDEENFKFVGQEHGAEYRIGDRVKVRIDTVDVPQRRAYFSLAQKTRT
ncbi:MAG: ribonuclease R [Spirochaetaceae bacterium]